MGKKVINIILIQILIILSVFLYLFIRNNKYSNFIEDSLSVTFENREISSFENKSTIYMNLEKGLLEGKTKISIRGTSIIKKPKEIFNILQDISNTNPEVMYYKGAEYSFGSLELFYSKPKDIIYTHQGEIRKIRDQFILNHISQEMNDYEKIVSIHDYIIETSEYDIRILNAGIVPEESYTGYGVLCQGKGVCEGYAKAMKYLLDGVGIESILVVGKSKGTNHAWNLVKIENEYYHVDPTWDDPITNDGTNIVRYNYLNLSDSEISKSHIWDREKYPIANGIKYNYFSYNNLIVYGIDQLENMIEETILGKKGKLEVKVKDYESNSININSIIEAIAYKNYELIKLEGYSYTVDEEHGIINIQFYYL